MDKPELHPCEYCGTMLDENGEVESNIAACGPRMAHYASQCVIYVHAAKESYKAELARLRAAVIKALEDVGPCCIVCAEDIESDLDPCDVPCSGLELRRLVCAEKAG